MGLKYSVKSNEDKGREKDSINYKKRKSCPEEIFESITGCKHPPPLIASGATTIGSASRAPNEINTKIMELS
jgi:hypothetical protein